MSWVLDCSLALSWGLPDETSEQADRFLAGGPRKGGLWVPALWWYELSNALATATRRKRLTEADGVRLLELYRALPIQTDTNLDVDAVQRFQNLARTYALSAYDAAYLELAQRRGLGLATLDRGLVAAARKAGIEVARFS